MDTDGLPSSGEVSGNINPQPDLLVNEANPDPMDADAWPESAEAPDISSPLVNSSGAVDHLNELALMELDAGCAGGGHPEASEAFRVTARLASPFASNGELGERRLIYCDDDPETGCRIYTRDPVPAGVAGDEDNVYE